jgi:hypothetical protein
MEDWVLQVVAVDEASQILSLHFKLTLLLLLLLSSASQMYIFCSHVSLYVCSSAWGFRTSEG